MCPGHDDVICCSVSALGLKVTWICTFECRNGDISRWLADVFYLQISLTYGSLVVLSSKLPKVMHYVKS